MLLAGWLGDTLSVSSISWAWLGDSGWGELAVSVLGVGDLPSARPSNSWTLRGKSCRGEVEGRKRRCAIMTCFSSVSKGQIQHITLEAWLNATMLH